MCYANFVDVAMTYKCPVFLSPASDTIRRLGADEQFTKKACEQIGINFELRLVGEARQGMDGEGVGIDVEEAILEVRSRQDEPQPTSQGD